MYDRNDADAMAKALADARRAYTGAKVLLFVGADLVVLRRDHAPGIVWPGALDLPGGLREGGETPETCACRETAEEVGLSIGPAALSFVALGHYKTPPDWFFACHLPGGRAADIRFGGEGAGWMLMRPEIYAAHPEAIPPFADIVRGYRLPG